MTTDGSSYLWQNIPIPDLSGVSQNIVPSANGTYGLGSATRGWKELYISDAAYIGGAKISTTNGKIIVESGGSTINIASEPYAQQAVNDIAFGPVTIISMQNTDIPVNVAEPDVVVPYNNVEHTTDDAWDVINYHYTVPKSGIII